jgi:hypothetical protein
MMQEITVTRSAFERGIENRASATELGQEISLQMPPSENPAFDEAALSNYPRFSWSVGPQLGEEFFDPNRPIAFQVFGIVAGVLELAPNWAIETSLTGNIWNDYNTSRPPGSDLPHVRTDFLQYIKKGAYGISSLDPVYRTRIADDVFVEAKAGYLEDMFMGAGGQLLWRPEDSRFAVGADLYEVWQRNFDRLFAPQNYHVLTGHVTVYYESPWNGINVAVHMGRYLAGDYGATFEVFRRFSTGVEIGAFATFTNVPFSEFGEGGFDKGLIIRIPLEWGLPIYSQSEYYNYLHSLTRDGGQRLAADDSLYEETLRTSDGQILEHMDDIVAP